MWASTNLILNVQVGSQNTFKPYKDKTVKTTDYIELKTTQFNSIYSMKTSDVKWLIAINRIQNKSFCLHSICMCAVYIYYVYINTHTYGIYFENIYMYIH